MINGPVIEQLPPTCSNGHLLGPNLVLVGWLPCPCAGTDGHRTWTCVRCAETLYRPEHDPAEDLVVGLGR